MIDHKTIIVVLGMHRCGTSTITRALKVLGVSLGDSLMPPVGENNSKGFWEDIDFNNINIELLKTLSHDWHTLSPISEDEFSHPAIASLLLRAVEMLREKLKGVSLFGVKDPRMARTMPFWQKVFDHLGYRVKFIIAVRNPANAARSLLERDGFALTKGYLLWHEHMVLSLQYSSAHTRLFVDYDNLIKNPETQLNRIAAALELELEGSSPEVQYFYNNFLESGLRHHSLMRSDLKLDPEAPAETIELSSLLFNLADDNIEDNYLLSEKTDYFYKKIFNQKPLLDLLALYDKKVFESEYQAQLSDIEAVKYRNELGGQVKAVSDKHAELELAKTAFEELELEYKSLATALSNSEQALLDLKEKLDAAEQRDVINTAIASANSSENMLHSAEIARLHSELKSHASIVWLAKQLIRSVVKLLRKKDSFKQSLFKTKLIENGLFDFTYYADNNFDVKNSGIDLFDHYMNHGWREGRDPSYMFKTDLYLEAYQDVRDIGTNPLLHYVAFGHKERRIIYNVNGTSYQFKFRKSPIQKLAAYIAIAFKNPHLVGRFINEVKKSGFSQAMAMAKHKLSRAQSYLDSSANIFKDTKLDAEYNTYKVVPFYINPYETEVKPTKIKQIAVHLHLFYQDMGELCIQYLNKIPFKFDLFISTPTHNNKEEIYTLFSGITNVNDVIVEVTPNRGRDIAPLIVQFGSRLATYEVIAHFHTKKSPHRESLSGWFDALISSLCGSEATVGQIFELLEKDAKVVYPTGNLMPKWDSGWSDNRELANAILTKHSDLDINAFPHVEFPQGTMFWASTKSIVDYLNLPLEYSDFPEEPIAPDATIAHALERLLLVFTTSHPGRNYRIEQSQLTKQLDTHYESQIDYTSSIVHKNIKVMAYYLPQFNPNPLNDEWHGKGFTEWHKVQSAQPLFQGHYQQHVPHEDVGYYRLDTPAQLRKQADQIKKSGVHGLIFYHYWFSGKLILEEPAQMLLANLDIDIPFCFCWANENWTRRWDGNEQEILLGQVYSPSDAKAFIRYLIPFFKDPRYVKVEDRPVIYVYRPSAMEFVDDYLKTWREECVLAGLKAPYVIATMTRGATTPEDYGMDAAVERVLQDWTGGAVEDIKGTIRPYGAVNGSILDYNAVADHYMQKPVEQNFMLLRSLVPTWDNTARYGSEAFLLHNFSVEKFQSWLEDLIKYTDSYIPIDRRFVIVNAWNEWAEGAHLEPDQRFGYGYLNAIGRALSDFSYSSIDEIQIPTDFQISLKLSDNAITRLNQEPQSKLKFITALRNSTLFEKCSITATDAATEKAFAESGFELIYTESLVPSQTLLFNDLYLFNSTCLETMAKMSVKFVNYNICASIKNAPKYVEQLEDNKSFDIDHTAKSGLEIGPFKQGSGFKVCTYASCFELPPQQASVGKVSTIIRFHRNGQRSLLDNAIYSLLTQTGSSVKAYIALQDFDDDMTSKLASELNLLPWDGDCEPVIHRYESTQAEPDLRSLMLNDMLKNVPKSYTAFLDYDDVLFPNAYKTLIDRLKETGKRITFGRVYSTQVEALTGQLLGRNTTYSYGTSFEDFLKLNHAPLHSFLIDLSKMNIDSLEYFPGMKYMEDYYLTLQLFTKNETDWQSLNLNQFIGDYIHRVGSGNNNTLAVSNILEREKLLSSAEYILSEQRISSLKERMRNEA